MLYKRWLAIGSTLVTTTNSFIVRNRLLLHTAVSPHISQRFTSYRFASSDVHHDAIFEYECESEEDIEYLGNQLAQVLLDGDVLLLKGDLGAGKTTLSRGIIRSLCGDEFMRVTSPSYLLDNTYEYSTGRYIHHMDLYRLPAGCDLGILGIPDIFDTSVCLIEWPSRMSSDFMPSSYLEINIAIDSGDKQKRSLQFNCVGMKWNNKMNKLDEILS
jgi:tRNA threonylcarbamoyl adenosine modification protein YjeE